MGKKERNWRFKGGGSDKRMDQQKWGKVLRTKCLKHENREIGKEKITAWPKSGGEVRIEEGGGQLVSHCIKKRRDRPAISYILANNPCTPLFSVCQSRGR